MRPDDNLLIYFSGHGHYDPVIEEAYWVPVDAEYDAIDDYISYSFLTKIIKAIPARHCVLIVDSCYSGAVLVRDRDRQTERFERDPSRWLLASGRNEVVPDGVAGGHSPFADKLLDILDRYAHEGLRMGTLVDKLTTAVSYNSTQTPIGRQLYGVGDQGGEFIFHPRKNEAADWADACARDDIAAYEAFVQAYPDSSHREAAHWAIARQRDSLAAYRHYLDTYPAGVYAREAIARMGEREDDQAYAQALRRGEAALRQYLLDYHPQGRHLAEAREAIRRIGERQAAEEAERQAEETRRREAERKTTRQSTQPASPAKQHAVPQPKPKPPQLSWRIPAGIAGGVLLLLLVWQMIPGGKPSISDKPQAAAIDTVPKDSPIAEKPQPPVPDDTLTLLGGYHQDIARYEEAGKTGYVRRDGTRITPARYDKGEDFRNDAAIVHLDGKRGYIDLSGKEFISPRYDIANDFDANGLAQVKQGGRSFTIDKTGVEQKPVVNLPEIEMVLVRGGTFTMGSEDGDSDEKPLHQVRVGDFYMGKYEVTQAQWRVVMGTNPSYFKNCDQCPVESVSWEDVQEFIRKLNALTGRTYRLPTEAEWEYAAGGGSGTRTKWAGTSAEGSLGSYAWYGANSGSKTHPVGQKQPNSLGLYDMTGNVWEWCQDWYGSYSAGAQTDPKGPSSGSSRVFRGGGWYGNAQDCRTAGRDRGAPYYRFSCVGFCLVFVP
ncbi:MAG: hypothetical protein OHK0039_34060 [Bacteroidia bacterium]